MSDYTDYAERMSRRYSVLRRIGQPDVPFEEGYIPLYVQRGPAYAAREQDRAQKALREARNRVQDEQIREALNERRRVDVLLSAPLGPKIPIREMAAQESRVVLLSGAGAGKSSALRFLVTSGVPKQDGERLTILVDLPKLVASEQTLPEYLAADAEQEMSLPLSPAFFEGLLSNGQATVCLDGLDEVPGQNGRVKVVEQIESWTEQYPRSRYIVAARVNAYEPTLSQDSFAHYVLLPWSETVVTDLETAWLDASSEWTAEEAQERLATAPRLLKDILAAREMAALFEDGKLNAGWTEIRSHLWDLEWRERIALAYRFLSQDHPEMWGKAMSLLLEAGANDSFGSVLHRHLLVGAAALAASDLSADLDQTVREAIVDGLVAWVKDPHAAGRQEAVDALLQLGNERYAAEQVLVLVADGETDVWAREAASLLAAKLCSANPSAAVDELRARIEDAEEHVRVRQTAATSLGYLASSAVLDVELQAAVQETLITYTLDSAYPIDVRTALAEALSTSLLATQDELIFKTLVVLARGEGEEKIPYAVQVAAAEGLSALLRQRRDGQSIEEMWAIARDEQVDESVRVELAETLGGSDSAQAAAQTLLAIAQSTTIYPPGRRAALQALGRLGYGDESIVEALVTISETQDRKTKDFERLAAARALGGIGQLDLSLQHLLMLIADKSIYRTTRNEALALLGEVGLLGDQDLDEASIAVLQVWVTEENTTEDVREQAMESLVMLQTAGEDIVRDLIGVMQDGRSYPRVRRAAVSALARLPIDQKDIVVESISVPFYDPEEKSDLLRVPIARLLYLWGGDERAAEYLRAAAEQSYMAPVRYRASIVLREIGDVESAVPALLKLATDASIADPIRCDSLRALSFWNVGDQELATQLLPIFEEKDSMPNVREAVYAAAKSLLAA